MGLGLLISGLIFGGAAISAGVDNANMMKEPYRYLDDGTPVYLDRKCQEWVNGEKIVATYDYQNKKLVYAGNKSGKVYLDPEENQKRRMDAISEENKKRAIKMGLLAYEKYDHKVKRMITCEISTGKYIAALQGNKYGGECRKFYLPSDYKSYTLYQPAENDKGVVITEDEFYGLNIVGGSHSAYGHR